jgi:hypothetical protein
MGRGLSDLQKWMLRTALDNREREGRDNDTKTLADLLFGEVKAGFYHLEMEMDQWVKTAIEMVAAGAKGWSEKDIEFRRERTANQRQRRGRHVYFGHAFVFPSRPALNVSISRAAARLEKRGYAVRVFGLSTHWAGIQLTDAGVTLARDLPAAYKLLPAPAKYSNLLGA